MKQQELTGKSTRFVFHEPNGLYSLECGVFHLEDLSPVLYLDGKKIPFGQWKILRSGNRSLTAEASGKAGKWLLKCTIDAQDTLTLAMSGHLKAPCKQIAVWYFENTTLNAVHLAVQGENCALLPLTGKNIHCAEYTGGTQWIVSHKGKQLRISCPLTGEHTELFKTRTAHGKLENFSAGFEIRRFASKQIRLKPLSFRCGNGFELMAAYGGENCTEKHDFSTILSPGWNSWDYYRWTVTEDEVLENAEFIAHDPVLSKYIKRIVIDDGWQCAYGEWEANSKFPNGMRSLADKLKKLGFQPGLWIAPLLAEPQSRIAQMEPDMLGKAENGQGTLCFECMKRHAFVLDPTVPKTRDFLSGLFDRYASAGYEFFKIDFLFAVEKVPRFAAPAAGRGRMMDLTLGPIREALSGRAQILGCGYPFNGGDRFVDSVRVGGDIHARWENIKVNTPSIALRSWANRKLWVNDPDFALCRSFDTANDPALNQMRCCLVYVKPEETDPDFWGGEYKLVDIHRPQAELLLSIVICSGGAINLSDKMTRLNESGIDLARRTVSAELGDTAVALDLFESALPSYWIQKTPSGHRVLLVNWEDSPAVRRLDLGALGIPSRSCMNFWNDRLVHVRNGILEEELPPRSCLFATVC